MPRLPPGPGGVAPCDRIRGLRARHDPAAASMMVTSRLAPSARRVSPLAAAFLEVGARVAGSAQPVGQHLERRSSSQGNSSPSGITNPMALCKRQANWSVPPFTAVDRGCAVDPVHNRGFEQITYSLHSSTPAHHRSHVHALTPHPQGRKG